MTRELNGQGGAPSSFDALHKLLEAQHYRLAYWRTSSDEINYRRFFDIDELVGVRMEDPEVFHAAHELLARLIAEKRVTGVRVDHLDGLAAPADYCARLQALSSPPVYVIVEKILASDQTLPEQWPIEGTTGYQFLNAVNGLFVQPKSWRSLQRAYSRFTGRPCVFGEAAYVSKRLVMDTTLSSELNALAQILNRLSEQDRRFRDFTLNSLRRALREFVACLAVYRTYLADSVIDLADELRIREAMAQARLHNPQLEPTIFEFVLNVLLGRIDADNPERRRFVTRLQQYTGSVQARGMEDTAFYRHNILISVNEVGGDPARPVTSVEDFHRANLRRQHAWPLDMLATATHDTKLGEDVRARIDVLSEYADRWPAVVRRWARLNAPNRVRVGGLWAPDRNDEYRFYQVLIGTWPAIALTTVEAAGAAASLVGRLDAYMQKAIKEAKLHTSWINDFEEYDRAVGAFVRRSLTGRTAPAFLESFLPFARQVATAGMVNSLSQLVLKLASPGVPDFYQGTELWDLHLVDPDNRHPVDFVTRAQSLRALDGLIEAAAGRTATIPGEDESGSAVRSLLEAWPDGRIKQFVTTAGLRLRRQFPEVFTRGAYLAAAMTGEAQAEVVAFTRTAGRTAVLAVAPRFTGPFVAQTAAPPIGESAWAGARIVLTEHHDGARWRNVLTGEVLDSAHDGERVSLPLARVLAQCPVALLVQHR
jgi:(1->4)-alpha-D-glucan 1-alpha-D-glucosylmutase